MTILHHLGYHLVITWSDKDQRYLVMLPEWQEDIIQPCTQGDTEAEAFTNGKYILDLFCEAANDMEGEV